MPGACRAVSVAATTRLATLGAPGVERIGDLPAHVYRPWAYVGTKRLGPVAPGLLREIAWADVVHCHQLHTFLADQCVLFGRLLGKRVFLTDHAGGDRHFNRRLRTLERATGLLLVSHFNAQGFARFAPKIRVIHGGADPERFAPRAVQRRRAALYAGRLIPYKSVHLLIQGVRLETEVRIAGELYHAEYFAYLRQLARGHNVHFLGAVLGDALINEYCRA